MKMNSKAKEKIHFIIVSPRNLSGGSVVLHVLCKYLLELGIDAKIFYSDVSIYKSGVPYRVGFWVLWLKYYIKDAFDWICCSFQNNLNRRNSKYDKFVNRNLKGIKRKYTPFYNRKDTVVIYPEMFYGNPLRARNVVRIILYYYKYKDNDDAYDKNDLFVTYRDDFNDADLNPNNFSVCTPYFDLEFYKQTNFGARKGTCYIIRKGKSRTDLPDKFDGIIIDDINENEKVKIFNRCEYCISYDTQTAYSRLASVCGCISVVMPEPGKDISDYRTEKWPRYGVAIGLSKEQKDFAMSTRNKLIEELKSINNEGIYNAKNFLDLCINKFNI